MKKLKFILPMLAFVAAFSASFALKADVALDQQLWYVNGSGQPTDAVSGNPRCSVSQANCAQMFEIVNGVPTTPVGDPIKGTRY